MVIGAGCRDRSVTGRNLATSHGHARTSDPSRRRADVAELHKIIANVKDALGSGSRNNSHPADASAAVPVAQSAQRAELASMFARALEEVRARFLGLVPPAALTHRKVNLDTDIVAKT